MGNTLEDAMRTDRIRTGLFAGAATVGRPSGIEGKNRVPRRARVTSREVEHLKTKAGIKAGGPGSGRRQTTQVGYHRGHSIHEYTENGKKQYLVKPNRSSLLDNHGDMDGFKNVKEAKKFVDKWLED